MTERKTKTRNRAPPMWKNRLFNLSSRPRSLWRPRGGTCFLGAHSTKKARGRIPLRVLALSIPNSRRSGFGNRDRNLLFRNRLESARMNSQHSLPLRRCMLQELFRCRGLQLPEASPVTGAPGKLRCRSLLVKDCSFVEVSIAREPRVATHLFRWKSRCFGAKREVVVAH